MIVKCFVNRDPGTLLEDRAPSEAS